MEKYIQTVSFGSLLLWRVKALNLNTITVRAWTTSLMLWNKFHSILFLLKNKTNIPHIFKHFYHSSNTTSNHIYARNAKNATQYDHELGVPSYQDDLLHTILNTHKITANIAVCFHPMLLGCTASQIFN